MHQHRRRKKRPSYGVRTVEISRGKNGFGFTISGQAPCILSCIIANSPAEKAGLRPGDFLIAVNGQNVSKAPHDDVVRLIGNSAGVLKLQIAENYYSDSSEEEFLSIVKLRHKYPNKTRNRQNNCVSRAERVVQDLQTGALFVDHIHGTNVITIPKNQVSKPQACAVAGPSRTNKVLLDLILQERFKDMQNRQSPLNSYIQKIGGVASCDKLKQSIRKENTVSKSRSHPENLNVSSSSPSEVFHSIFTEQDANNVLYPTFEAAESREEKDTNESVVLKAVVGYLGTIEMPKEPQLPNSRLQTIRNCIRRLRVEKKVHTLVLMSVFTDSIILINPQGLTLAEFSADKITFSGVYSDDKKFFGLVTSHGRNDELNENIPDDPGSVSSSCHVFMVDPKLTPHHQHVKRAKAFRFTCTSDPVTKKCKEFPESADNILQAVVGLYRSKLGLKNNEFVNGLEFHVNMSPLPSNTSSNSSNSDSGIGNASDRVFVVDVDNYYLYGTNSLNRQGFPNAGFGSLESPLRSFSVNQDGTLSNSKSHLNSQSNEANNNLKSPSSCHFDRLTVRAMPDPVGFEPNGNCYDSMEPATSSTKMNVQSKQDPVKVSKSLSRLHASALHHSGTLTLQNHETPSSSGDGHIDKLSPKVYNLNFPLKSEDEMAACNTSADSIGWECTSCSTEDLEMEPQAHRLMHRNRTEHEDGSQVVHPPTDDDCSVSCISGMDNSNDSSRKWGRTSSLRRHVGRKRSLYRSTHDAGTVSDGEIASGKVSTSSSMLALDRMTDTSEQSSASERPVDVGRVGAWASRFDVLLEDPAGLQTFREFLKMEFSEENVTFWIACENYRQLTDHSKMLEMAQDIYSKHLCMGAHEPVNVDSHARSLAADGLQNPTAELFMPAQKQIFNLMKFDCYQRFLKSVIFKECLLREMEGRPLLFDGESSDFENEREKAGSEFKKKKSLIPWHRLNKAKSNESKNGSSLWNGHYEIRKSLKKKKKNKGLEKVDDTSSTQSDWTGSRSSLNSSENGAGAMFYKNRSSRESLNSADLAFHNKCVADGFFCRVLLPDLSTTVVRVSKGETVGEMLLKLLERRSLEYNAVEAYLLTSHEPLDHCTEVASLECKQIKVEQVILFCVQLPNKKTIGVKAKNNRLCGQILKPVLYKYGYSVEDVTMTVASSKTPVSKNAPITMIDNERIIVELKDIITEPCGVNNEKSSTRDVRSTPSFPDLEELTNQIFDDLLKSRPEFHYDGFGAVTTEKNSEKKLAFTPNSRCYTGGHSQQDSDTLPSVGKHRPAKKDGAKLTSEHKPLLAHNPTRIKDQYPDTIDSLHLPLPSEQFSGEIKFDASLADFSHGKENCPFPSASDLTSQSAVFNTSNIDFGLAAALKTLDPSLATNIAYSSSQLTEKYFSRVAFPSDDYEVMNSKTFLKNLGIIPSDVSTRNVQWSKSRHVSHTPPRIPPRVRAGDQKESFALNKNASSPTSNLDATLTANDSFELDLDVDVTLHAHSDDSFTQESSSIMDEMAKREVSKDGTFPLRRLPCEPPPVPPKVTCRGPPPRPPSRQHSNPAFGLTSDEDVTDEDTSENRKSDLGFLQNRNSHVTLDKDYAEFSISFV